MSRWLDQDRSYVHNVRPIRVYDRTTERDTYTSLALSLLIAEGLQSSKPAVVEAAEHMATVVL